MRRLAALLVAIALLAGCSSREHANPLDPANPNTGGGPSGFDATADYGLVRLRWDPHPELAIDGFRLQRLTPGDSLYRTIATLLPPSASNLLDSGVRNGDTYRYRLEFVVGGAATGRVSEDRATPGPARAWVADANSGLLRIAPDGVGIPQIAAADQAPTSLAPDPVTGVIWFTSGLYGTLGYYENAVLATFPIPGMRSPFEIEIDPADHSAWVSDPDAGEVRHWFDNGSAATPGRLTPLDQPSGLAVNHLDRSLWVCERGGDRVRHYDVRGSVVATAFVTAPSRVAVDSVSGVAWVTSLDRGLIVRVGANGQRIDSLDVAKGPIGIAIDRARGRVWVADAAGDRVIALRLDTAATEFIVAGLTEARDVAVDPLTGEAWVVARGAHAIVRLSPTGAELGRTSGLADPWEIRLETIPG